MKNKIFLTLLLTLIILYLPTTIAQNLRKIQVLPSPVSKINFKPFIIRVTFDYFQKYLVGHPEYTYVDITDYPEHEEPEKLKLAQEPDYPRPSKQSVVKPLLPKATSDSTRAFLNELCSFPHRRSDRQGSQDSVLWIKRKIEEVLNGLNAERKSKFKIELIKVPRFIADSIIVTFEGSGNDNEKSQHVMFGAHHDDVGHPQAGADDNGSSSTAVYESFKVIAQSDYTPKKTLVWLFYSAEEYGLVGSYQISNDFRLKQKKVFSHLNCDMTGNHPSSITQLQGRRLTINTTPKLTEYMNTISKEYTALDINTWAFNGGSDHIPWTRAGYPSACLTERVFSPHYHLASDKPQHVNFNLITEFSRLAIAYMIEAS